MRLNVDCTWNNKKNKGQVVIVYENLPKKLFLMDAGELQNLQILENDFLSRGTEIVDEFQRIYLNNPQSIYAFLSYFQALRTFKFFDKARDLFQHVKKKFPREIITRCIEAHYFLEDKKETNFIKTFSNHEVLKGVFPKRKLYHYKEALCFHSAWHMYFSLNGNLPQASKHEKFMTLILNTKLSFKSAGIT